ncbi:hypothetical protein DFQ27_006743 [Actinomortierella ambigua]|uniref:Uncharacterized protein n=1 Tax=Actinomortierella ambigua TaxID=1343610 RepID=A0A9P6PY86_9FUNG|nr:hypothetical protein DFQ27_006743 [Actinomortierella ambigua]
MKHSILSTFTTFVVLFTATATATAERLTASTKPRDGYYHLILGHQYLTAATGGAAVRLVSEPQGPLSEWRIVQDAEYDDGGYVISQALTGQYLGYDGDAMPYAYVRVGKEAAIWEIRMAEEEEEEDDDLSGVYKHHGLVLGRHPSREFPRYVGLWRHPRSDDGEGGKHRHGNNAFEWRLKRLEAAEQVHKDEAMEQEQTVLQALPGLRFLRHSQVLR